MEKLEWSAPEYEDKERGSDWFWALGIIVVAGSAASIIYSNYFFAVILILGGILLRFFAIKKPAIVHYELGEKGLKIGENLYPYENIKSFCIHAEPKPMFLAQVDRLFLPIIAIPIEANWDKEIHAIMKSNNIIEEELQIHASERIMESLGF
jgi:hypothetical protein